MNNLTAWMKSTRSIAVILTFVLLFISLNKGILTGDNIMAIATGVILGYFGRRDSESERNQQQGQ